MVWKHLWFHIPPRWFQVPPHSITSSFNNINSFTNLLFKQLINNTLIFSTYVICFFLNAWDSCVPYINYILVFRKKNLLCSFILFAPITNILYSICLFMYFVNSKRVSPLGFKYGVHVTLMKQVLWTLT
jgi:hypothetical protein